MYIDFYLLPLIWLFFSPLLFSPNKRGKKRRRITKIVIKINAFLLDQFDFSKQCCETHWSRLCSPMFTNNIYHIAIVKFPPTFHLYLKQEDDEEDQDEDWDDDLDDEEVINMKVTLMTFQRVPNLNGFIQSLGWGQLLDSKVSCCPNPQPFEVIQGSDLQHSMTFVVKLNFT